LTSVREPGKVHEAKVQGGVVGLIMDCRGRRPFALPSDDAQRVKKLTEWNAALNVYPENELK
jgi:hypothetical protein